MGSRFEKYKKYHKDGILGKMIRRKLVNMTRPFWIILMKFFPINNNKVCFDSFEGTGFGGDPKYICLELMKQRPDLEIIWFVRKRSNGFPDGIKQVYIDGISAIYHQSTAKVWVDNTRTGHRTKKRNGQYYLQTWHGQVVSKKIEKDAEDKLSPEYIEIAKYDGKITDAAMASNELFEDTFRNSFWLSKETEILKSGSPSNDVLFTVNNQQALRIKIGVSNDAFVILYAPTFRDDLSIEGYLKDYSTVINAFEKKYRRKCVLLLRYHPDIASVMEKVVGEKNVLDVTSYSDIKELAIIADFIITDYSSIISDFILQKKPGIRYCSDIRDYSRVRGMYDTFYELPYTIVESSNKLLEQILEFNVDCFYRSLDEFINKYKQYDNGTASKVAIDWILKKLNCV